MRVLLPFPPQKTVVQRAAAWLRGAQQEPAVEETKTRHTDQGSKGSCVQGTHSPGQNPVTHNRTQRLSSKCLDGALEFPQIL